MTAVTFLVTSLIAHISRAERYLAQDVDGIPKIYYIVNSNEIPPILVREPMRCQGSARNRFLIAALTPAKVVLLI